MTTNERNEKVTLILNKCFDLAENGKYKTLSNELLTALQSVFSSTVWGFREILLVIVIARLLDENYKPSQAFYKCNPRALYEGPIRDILLKRRIPHKKSGPLNVAKATVSINSQWAAQRRPAKIAEETVKLVSAIESFNSNQLYDFAANMAHFYMNEAKRVSDLSVEIPPQSDILYLYDICEKLIKEVPDAGNTPQRIVGLLLQVYHEELQSGIMEQLSRLTK